MLIILGFLVLTGVGFLIHFLTDDYENGWAIFGTIFGTVLVLVLMLLPLIRAGSAADVSGFNAVRQTLEVARASSDVSELELAAIQQKVVEQNRLLATAQYWARNPLTNWFYVREILELEPIQ